ncbi:MAG: rhomboid family intramembrane serine protease [Actinomycetaceae bacterium]|nr:rhomboid family intramembrane serine protease [Actinomycetaceae bacterium]
MTSNNDADPPVGGGANRGKRRRFAPIPRVTGTIIVISVLAAIVQQVVPQVGWELAFAPVVALVEPYRFITSAFLHAGFYHIAFNMYALLILGMQLEPLLGRVRFLTLYLVSAIGGNAAVMVLASLTGWNGVAVGASGAIFGLFGALMVVLKAFNRDLTGLLVVLGINVVIGFIDPRISWESHLGGFLTGIVIMLLWNSLLRARSTAVQKAVVAGREVPGSLRTRWMVVDVLLGLAVAIVLGIIVFAL